MLLLLSAVLFITTISIDVSVVSIHRQSLVILKLKLNNINYISNTVDSNSQSYNYLQMFSSSFLGSFIVYPHSPCDYIFGMCGYKE